jgi:hypothetical protein
MDPNALKNAWTQWMSGLAQGGQGPRACMSASTRVRPAF